MTKERLAWAITTGTPNDFIGVGWFDDFGRPWNDGLRVALFRTRAEARRHLGRVKGPTDRGRFPLARVVRVEICITARKS